MRWYFYVAVSCTPLPDASTLDQSNKQYEQSSAREGKVKGEKAQVDTRVLWRELTWTISLTWSSENVEGMAGPPGGRMEAGWTVVMGGWGLCNGGGRDDSIHPLR